MENRSQQKQMEKKLSESEDRFRAQYKYNPMPTFTWQKTGDNFILKDYNKAADVLTRGDASKYLNMTAAEMYKNRPEILEAINCCYIEKSVIQKELHSENFVTPRIFSATWSFVPPDLVIVYMEDITSRRQEEEERLKLQQRLQQAQKMESIGRLTGGIAHDFNNMLTVILGYTELIKSHLSQDDPFRVEISEIEKAAVRSRDIIRQLLAFSRKEVIAPEPVDFNVLIENMQKTLLRLIGEDIDLKFYPGEDLWNIKVDPSQMQQILINFSVNARDAMLDGGKLTIETENIHIHESYCKTHPEFFPGEYVLLGVSDDGIGMDRETMSHLFEPFFTTKEKGKGTGLGLATVYGIVKQNKGFINVYSEPECGTTFKIYIPRSVDEITRDDITEDTQVGHDTGIVLLVEDNEMVRTMTTEMLEAIGYTVVAAASPEEALSFFDQVDSNVDLIITDVVMPQMNGRELSERIIKLRPGTRVLFMSGYTTNVIVHRGVLADGVHFLNKPFSMNDLACKIRDALGRQ